MYPTLSHFGLATTGTQAWASESLSSTLGRLTHLFSVTSSHSTVGTITDLVSLSSRSSLTQSSLTLFGTFVLAQEELSPLESAWTPRWGCCSRSPAPPPCSAVCYGSCREHWVTRKKVVADTLSPSASHTPWQTSPPPWWLSLTASCPRTL